MTTVHDIDINRGDTTPIQCEATQDLNGRLLTITVKRNARDPDSAAIIQRTVAVATAGTTHTITLLPSETALLDRTRYAYDFQIVGNVDDVKTEQRGSLNVTRDITRTIPTETDPAPGGGGDEVFFVEYDDFEVTA